MIFELIGWVGTLAVLTAYFLITTQKLHPKSRGYQLLNLFGALGIIINSWMHQALPSVGLNIVWLLIAVLGITRSKYK